MLMVMVMRIIIEVTIIIIVITRRWCSPRVEHAVVLSTVNVQLLYLNISIRFIIIIIIITTSITDKPILDHWH